ncbi:MAG: transposase family protein [Deltaproteobacteria bacterium]|nr:transposase family protein [Deltaproteobacteria bacterium]
MTQDPLRIACWRFEQISPFLDDQLTHSERHRLIKNTAKVPVVWPSGREDIIPVSTIYRWLKAYKLNPDIKSLWPKPRVCKKNTTNTTIESAWLQHALALLEAEPDRSLFILSLNIKNRFNLDRPPARSSLYRALIRENRYTKIVDRRKGHKKMRNRFQAEHPHDIWHADAKSEFDVKFSDGTTQKVKVLSILDDASRFILAALIVQSESIQTAVATFRRAAARYGLPAKFYADRGSAYDSYVFRKGLAVLGVHRINTKSHNPEAHGKIEAYHRTLKSWFVKELKHQLVLDRKHLQDLLHAVLDEIYHQHKHKELNTSPLAAFKDTVSRRTVSVDRLTEAFLIEKSLVPHHKTGTITVDGTLFFVPKEYHRFSRQVRIAIDPEHSLAPRLMIKPGVFMYLEPAIKKAGQKNPVTSRIEPVGSLTPILEKYRGRKIPLAYPAFGLPEIYHAFSVYLGRSVPATEQEATAVVDWLKKNGPFDPRHFEAALSDITKHLGPGRPLTQIIQALEDKIVKPENPKETL